MTILTCLGAFVCAHRLCWVMDPTPHAFEKLRTDAGDPSCPSADAGTPSAATKGAFQRALMMSRVDLRITEIDNELELVAAKIKQNNPTRLEPPRVPWRPVGLSHAGVAA